MLPAPEEVFEEIAASGGMSRYSGDKPRIEALKRLAIGYCEASRQWTQTNATAPQIFVDITTGSSLNALATHRSGKDYIAINKGVEELIRSVFYNLLKLHEVFPKVGTVPTVAPVPPWANLPRDTAFMGDPVVPPEDGDRHYLADRLTQYAYEFLVAHEIAHVMRGHIRLKIGGQHFDIDESATTESAPSDELCLVRHTLEMDADAFATVQGMANIIKWASGNGREGALLRDKYTAIEYWLFSIHCMFRLLSPTPIVFEKLCDIEHPPARMRQSWMISTGVGLCYAGVCDLDHARFTAIAFETAEHVDQCINMIAPDDLPLDKIWISEDPKADEHLVRLAAKWCEIRPDLVKVSYVANLTPCTDPLTLASLTVGA